MSDVRIVLGLAPVDPDVLKRFGPPTYTEEQVLAYAKAELSRLEGENERLRIALDAETIDGVLGYCRNGGGCVCGGDVPEIRAMCGNWAALLSKGSEEPAAPSEGLPELPSGSPPEATVGATAALAGDWSEFEDEISDAISDSIDMDWTSRDGAKAVIRFLNRLHDRLPDGSEVNP